MHRREERHPGPAEHGKWQPIDVGVDHVEVARALGNGFYQQRTGGVRVRAPPAQAQCARPHRAQLSFRLRISAREQGDVVSEADQLVHQPGDHPLRAPIKLWRNALGQRGELGNPHRLGPEHEPQDRHDTRGNKG